MQRRTHNQRLWIGSTYHVWDRDTIAAKRKLQTSPILYNISGVCKVSGNPAAKLSLEAVRFAKTSCIRSSRSSLYSNTELGTWPTFWICLNHFKNIFRTFQDRCCHQNALHVQFGNSCCNRGHWVLYSIHFHTAFACSFLGSPMEVSL